MKKTFIIFLFFSFTVFSQDPVFTQFYNVPDYLNPSFSGSSGGTNISVLNRTQWFGLNYGLNSQFFSIDGFSEKMNSGLGLSIMNHQESTTRYNFTQMNFNYSYQVKLNRDWGFYPSISAGFGTKDYAFDNLKNDKLINTISNYGLGSNPSIDTKISTLTSNNGKLKYFHKNFETSEGKGVIGGNTMGKLFYEFGFFTADKSANLNEDFISELLSSLKISWANKGVQTSINLSGGSGSGSSIQEFNSSATNKSNNSSSSSQSFIEMCKNSKLSDLDKDVALLCLEKID